MTKGPPLAISSLIGLPDITRNFAFDFALTFNSSPFESNIKVLSLTSSCLLVPISISPLIK